MEIPEEKFLYHLDMGGKGVISCNECDFKQEIVSFLHGFGKNPWICRGFQCQSCGKFHDIERIDGKYDKTECECGGILENENPLFCPVCKSHNMSYNMEYIT